MKIFALIPVRGGSVRIKNKNVARLGPETLLERKIRQLKGCKRLSEIVVGSDDDALLSMAQAAGARTVRRAGLACDEKVASANMMIADFVSRVSCDLVIWVHVTNPFVDSATYDAAIDRYCVAHDQGTHDSLLSVLPLQEHLWSSDKRPMNYDPYQARHPLASELAPLYKQTGAFFIQPHASMVGNSYFFSRKPLLFETTQLEAIDINTEFDLLVSRAILAASEEASAQSPAYFTGACVFRSDATP